ncbi:MAG: hypothetical protein CALGDGBN_00970 [Pseudomonadales bacterium]|nr:hypothetical protein [Pseudomonadales bacterium]
MELTILLPGLLGLGFACQWLAWRMRLPGILFLLLAGLALGPLTGLFDPQAVFGTALFPIVQLGVALILFEGSLTLRFREIRDLAPAILLIVTLGALVTLLGLAWAAHVFAGLDWSLALLFGALCCVTGPTVIGPLLRSVRPTAAVAHLLRWEGIVIDPIGALLAVIAFDAVIVHGQENSLLLFAATGFAGLAVGFAAGFGLAALLRRQWAPDYLENFLVLAAVLAASSLANALAHESGLLAVTVMGIVLANARSLDVEHILHFKENLSTVIISMLFLLLAARIEWPSAATLVAGVAVLVVATLFVRPAAVLVSTLGSPLSWRERALVAYIAPRGIVAAAVSALFALRLEQRGFADADTLVHLTFMIIIGTVVIQSASAARVARALGVVAPDPRGVLIVGATRFARQLADLLRRQDVPVIVADDDWNGIREARMAGLETYYGNPVTEKAAERLPLAELQWMLAISSSTEMNALACLRYRDELGRKRVLRLPVFAPGEAPRSGYAAAAPELVGPDTTQVGLEQRLDEGWTLRVTRLSEAFGWKQLREKFAVAPVVLFVIDERGELRFAADGALPEPRAGWRVGLLGESGQRA